MTALFWLLLGCAPLDVVDAQEATACGDPEDTVTVLLTTMAYLRADGGLSDSILRVLPRRAG